MHVFSSQYFIFTLSSYREYLATKFCSQEATIYEFAIETAIPLFSESNEQREFKVEHSGKNKNYSPDDKKFALVLSLHFCGRFFGWLVTRLWNIDTQIAWIFSRGTLWVVRKSFKFCLRRKTCINGWTFGNISSKKCEILYRNFVYAICGSANMT